MTSVEIQNDINIELDQYKEGNFDPIESYESEYLMNKAQDIIFQRYYDEFEQSEGKRFAIDELITTAILSSSTDLSSSQVGAKTNGQIWKMPTDFYYSTEEFVTDSSGNNVTVKPITRDFYLANIDNPFKTPYNLIAWRLDHKPSSSDVGTPKRRETITDGSYTVSTYTITYIKRPQELVIDTNNTCELGYKATKELITEAVKLYYSINKDTTGYQLKDDETLKD